MAENAPPPKKRPRLRLPPGLYPVRTTGMGRMGVMFSPELLARMLSVRWGIPLPDRLKRAWRGAEQETEAQPPSEPAKARDAAPEPQPARPLQTPPAVLPPLQLPPSAALPLPVTVEEQAKTISMALFSFAQEKLGGIAGRLLLGELCTFEKAIRTLPHGTRENALSVFDGRMRAAFEDVASLPEYQRAAELYRRMNAMDYLIGRACSSEHPEEWFRFIRENQRIFEFGLVAKRFVGAENGSDVRVNGVALDRSLLDEIVRATSGLTSIQDKFDAILAPLKAHMPAGFGELEILVFRLKGDDEEARWRARAELNDKLSGYGIVVESGLCSDEKEGFDIVRVKAVMSTREGKALLVESIPGLPQIKEGLGGQYNSLSDSIIVVKREPKITEDEEKSLRTTMTSLGLGPGGMPGKAREPEPPTSAVMWHEVRHYLDALSGYLEQSRRMAQDGRTIRAGMWMPERLPPGVLTEATAFADAYIRSAMSDEEIRADLGQDAGYGIHSWARTIGISWWLREKGVGPKSATGLAGLMAEFIDEEYVRVLGLSSSELYGIAGKTPAEIIALHEGRIHGRASPPPLDICRTALAVQPPHPPEAARQAPTPATAAPERLAPEAVPLEAMPTLVEGQAPAAEPETPEVAAAPALSEGPPEPEAGVVIEIEAPYESIPPSPREAMPPPAAPPPAPAAIPTEHPVPARIPPPTIKSPRPTDRSEPRPTLDESFHPPAMGELLSLRHFVIRSGKPTAFSHPALPGIAFSEEEWDLAARHVILSETLLMCRSEVDASLPAGERHPAEFVKSHPDFVPAAKAKDRSAQLRICLEARLIAHRAGELSPFSSPWSEDLHAQAAEDVLYARRWTDAYLNKSKAGPLQRCVRRMVALAKDSSYLDAPAYDLAMAVVNETRRMGKPLAQADAEMESVPQAPPPDAPALAAPAQAQPSEAPSAQESAAEPAAPSPVPQPAQPLPQAEGVLPKFEFPEWWNNKDMFPDVEGHLPKGRDRHSALVRRVARALMWYYKSESEERDIDPRCLAAVRALRESYSPENVPLLAQAIVDAKLLPAAAVAEAARSQVPAPAPLPEEHLHWDAGAAAQPKVRLERIMLDNLGDAEKALVAAVMQTQQGVCDDAAVAAFVAMHPGQRELLMQRFIASRWKEGDFRTDIHKFNRAKERVYELTSQLFGFAEPTAEEKLEAISDQAGLTSMQKSIVASFFGMDAAGITPEHIAEFGVWVSSDPDTHEGRQALEAYWNSHYPDYAAVIFLAGKVVIPDARYIEPERNLLAVIFGKKWDGLTYEELRDGAWKITAYARRLQSKNSFWMHTPYGERLGFWKKDNLDAMSAGRLVHHLRGYDRKPALSREEAALVSWIYGTDPNDTAQPPETTRNRLASAFSVHTLRAEDGNGNAVTSYFPEIQKLAALGNAVRSVSLADAAMKEAEVNTLLDFCGAYAERAYGTIHSRHGGSRAGRDKNDRPKPNDDSCSSAQVLLPSGASITLDMVADGMGGHTEGANGGKTNGQVASGIAREMFDIAAVAGWIRTPEDVRRLMLAVDIAIVVEQIYKKDYACAEAESGEVWRRSGIDPADPSLDAAMKEQFMLQVERIALARMRSNDLSPESMKPGNNMGTTMTVAFQEGDECWFIHCGDSDGKIIRDGEVVFSTAGHSAEYDTRMESGQKARAEIHADCEADARAQVEKIWKDAGCDSATLSDDPNDASHNDRLEFESQVRQRADELAGEREDRIRQRADEIFREYVAAIVEKKVGEGAAMYWKAQGVDMTALDEAQKAELARQVDVAFKARVSGMETQARMETINAFASGNIDPANLSPMERAEFERQVQCAVDKLMADIAFAKNEVSSALGVRPRYIHINNTERGHAPIVLEAGDALLVASDGVTVPVCDHEYGISLFTACSGDMEAARNYILDVAEMRRKELHEPMCGCKPRKGRKDDMSLLFRYAEEAFPGADAYYNKACSLAWLGRRVAMQPKEYPVSKSFRMIMDGCRAGSMKPGRLMYLFDALMDGADEAPKGKRDDAYNAVIGTVFGIVSQRDDRDELIRMLTPKIGSWSGRIMRLLQESPEASPCERAMFDLVRQSVSTAELGGLLSARRSVIIGWAVEAMDAGAVHAGAADTGAERPDTTARGADAAAGGGAPVSGQAPQPIFHSQTDERGRPLDGSATRYLDAYLQGLSDSSIVQNVAARLGVLPRDLEIMVFQVYSDFRRDVAVNPHMSAEGQQLIAEVGDHLCTGDAERILMASYLIHRLMGRPADSVQAREMVEALHTTVEGMDPFATYPQRFNNKTYELRRGYDRGSDDS